MAFLHGELMGWVRQAGAGHPTSPRCRSKPSPWAGV